MGCGLSTGGRSTEQRGGPTHSLAPRRIPALHVLILLPKRTWKMSSQLSRFMKA